MSNNKYKKLVDNTIIFALGTFGSKVLVVLLMPLYTRLLTPSQYGEAGLLVDTCNLIYPVMCLTIYEAVIRFGMDKSSRKSDIFSTGVYVVFIGYILLLLCRPLLKQGLDVYAAASDIVFTSNPIILVSVYVLTSSLRSVITQFVRASGFVRIFALDGIFTTVATVIFNVIFLAAFNLGVTGYVLATIAADGLSALGLFFFLRLYRFLKFHGIDWNTVRSMLRFSIPLVPTAVFWWVTNLSDRYMVVYFHGLDISGLYDAAYKLPTIITLISTIFIRAWELSAFTEYKSKEAASFYSTVFKSYYTFIFVAASGIILMVKPFTSILVDPSYFASWRYVPFLVLGVAFSCLVTFMGSIYMAAKKTAMSFFTTFLGAGMNIVLNLILIPEHEALGAAFATFVSYLAVYVVRAIDTRRFIKIQIQPFKMFLIFALLLLQCWLALSEAPFRPLWECLVLLLIIVLNLSQIRLLLEKFLQVLQTRRGKSPE